MEERTGAGTDHSSNSKESPPLLAFELLPPLNFTPFKSAFSPFYPWKLVEETKEEEEIC